MFKAAFISTKKKILNALENEKRQRNQIQIAGLLAATAVPRLPRTREWVRDPVGLSSKSDPSAFNSECPIFSNFESNSRLRYPDTIRSSKSDVDTPGVLRVGMNFPEISEREIENV